MNKYESIIIINPNNDETEINNIINKISNLINENGIVESVEKLGKKRLAYEIKKNKEGHYVIINFEANNEFITELERNYRIMQEIIKFIVIRK